MNYQQPFSPYGQNNQYNFNNNFNNNYNGEYYLLKNKHKANISLLMQHLLS